MIIDSIATRDLGFGLNSCSGLLTRTNTVQSTVSESPKPASQSRSQSSSSKRASPDHPRRRDESRDYPSKRARPGSPSRSRDRDNRDSPSHSRHGSPMWRRYRERDDSRRFKDEREGKGVQLSNVISEFIATLPATNTFDGASSHCLSVQAQS